MIGQIGYSIAQKGNLNLRRACIFSIVRLLRDNVVIFDGKLASLKHLQNDVKEVKAGYECGIGLESFQDIKPGDVFEVYKIEEIKAEL